MELQQSLASGQYKTVELDPAAKGFQRLDANVGSFAVSLDDVRPFADGVQVKLNLGNLTAAAFAGAKLTLKYGPRGPDVSDAEFGTKHDKWKNSIRSKDEVLTERLLSGHWNPVQIVLPGLAAKDFGYLEVSIVTDQIFLFR